MPRSVKLLTIAALWATLGFSAAFAVPVGFGKVLLIAIGMGVTFHLMRIRTTRPGLDAVLLERTEAPKPSGSPGS